MRLEAYTSNIATLMQRPLVKTPASIELLYFWNNLEYSFITSFGLDPLHVKHFNLKLIIYGKHSHTLHTFCIFNFQAKI